MLTMIDIVNGILWVFLCLCFDKLFFHMWCVTFYVFWDWLINFIVFCGFEEKCLIVSEMWEFKRKFMFCWKCGLHSKLLNILKVIVVALFWVIKFILAAIWNISSTFIFCIKNWPLNKGIIGFAQRIKFRLIFIYCNLRNLTLVSI